MKRRPYNFPNRSDNYSTPNWLIDLFEGWFDPCPLNPNPNVDGLEIEWKNKTYVNPPYSNPLPWVEKAIKERNKGKIIVMLLRADPSTKVFAKLIMEGAYIFFMYGRIYFGRKDTLDNRKTKDYRMNAYFPSMLVILHPEKKTTKKGVGK